MSGNHKPAHPEDQMLQATMLLDVYGELLTERQREFMRLHFEEDLSFSQIARDYHISRQAVHDSVKHAIESLRNFERVLGLVGRNREEKPLEAQGRPQLTGRQLLENLATLRRRLEEPCDPDQRSKAREELDRLLWLIGGPDSQAQPPVEA